MDKNLQKYIEDNFLPTHRVDADGAVVKKYSTTLPENLLGIWRLHGWSAYFDGLFWIVNPDEYLGVTAAFLRGTELEDTKFKFFCVGRGAFGDLLLLEQTSGAFALVNAVFSTITVNRRKLARSASDRDKEVAVFSKFAMFNKDDFDLHDDGIGLFSEAFSEFGHLGPDEIYGFEPLLSLGGRLEAGHIAKVNDKVHLSIVRETAPPTVKFF